MARTGFQGAGDKRQRLILYLETMKDGALKIVGTPVGFVLTVEDRHFQEAQAELVGKTSVAVWSDKVSKPVTARFARADRAYINSWAESGLPTNPFRTDNWPMSQGGEGPFASAPPRTPEEVRPSQVGLSAEGPSTSMWNMCYS